MVAEECFNSDETLRVNPDTGLFEVARVEDGGVEKTASGLTAGEANLWTTGKAFTPTIYTGTNPGTLATQGNGVWTGMYAIFNDKVYFNIEILWGTTTSLNGGTGVMRFPVPVRPAVVASKFNVTDNVVPISGSCMMTDASVPAEFAYNLSIASSTTLTPYIVATNDAGSFLTGITPVAVWTTSDRFCLTGSYRL